MRLLDKLERKFGRYAIRGLMHYIVWISGFVFILMMVNGQYIKMLELDPHLVRQGQLWRLVTYIFIPPLTSPIFVIFALLLYYTIGGALEQEWGSFRFNVYYFLGMIGTTAAVFITGGSATSTYINLSLFLAFARIYPDFELRIYFILPVKIKYLAWISWAYIGFTVLFSPHMSLKIAAVVSIINYFIFFGRDIVTRFRNKGNAYNNKRRFQQQMPVIKNFHRCEVCGITENDNPNMEFRYCSTCKGLHEYCMDHLRNHEHKTE
jgi:hypothetical protein